MYHKNKIKGTSINVNNSSEGETIEDKIARIVNNKEPIKDGSPPIFTERSEGVKPEHDIRTDRWELAIEAVDKRSSDQLAKRKAELDKLNEIGKPESIQGSEPVTGTN